MNEFESTLKAALEKMFPDVEVVIGTEAEGCGDPECEACNPEKFAEHRAGAVKALRRLQAELLKAYDIAKALERSIRTPKAERTAKHTVDEMLLAMDLARLHDVIAGR